MRNLLTLCIVFFFCVKLVAKETERLPEIPWANLVEMHSSPETRNGQWGVNVEIKLVGSYSLRDSLIVAESIEQLDAITETISIGFSEWERGNLEIFFIDSVNTGYPGYYLSYSKNNKNEKISKSHVFISDTGRTYSRIIFEKNRISPLVYKQVLKNNIAKEIGGGYLSNGTFVAPNGKVQTIEALKIAKNRNSIFNKYENVEAHRQELNDLDIAIIKETYKPGYKEKLEIAREQFKVDPWWLKVNPAVVLLLPFGIIFLVLAFIALSVFIWLTNNVKNRIIAFNLKVIVSLFLIIFLLENYSYFHENWYYLAQGKFPFSPTLFVKYFVIMFANAGVFFIPAVNLIAYLERMVKKRISSRIFQFGLIFIFTFFIPLFALIILNIISLKKYDQITEDIAISQISTAFIIFLILAGLRVIIDFFLTKEHELVKANENKLSTLRELKTKAELNALHSRINPHFLYNSLNSIAGLAHEDADKTEHMALSLSRLFRYSINKEKSDLASLKEELEIVNIYLDVEKVRFDDRLSYSIECSKELENEKIPRFIIQPLVENALKHGISGIVEGGEIKIHVTKDQSVLSISVFDTGEPFPDDMTPSFGIQSIYDKLEILYPGRFELNFTNSPKKGVTIKLKQNGSVFNDNN